MSRRFTLVSVHAHPDDEALLTAGTLARAAAEGHRVVLVVATAGEQGLTGARVSDLGSLRRRELARSAAAVGVERVVELGYPDSGWTGAPDAAPGGFAALPVEDVAERLAALLAEERADVVTGYDAHGGYGHPDHVQVHRVTRRAAELAGTRVVLEATLDRQWIQRIGRVAGSVARVLPTPDVPDLSRAFLPPGDITHRVDVGRFWPAKRAALSAHASQATGGPRTLGLVGRVPAPVLRRAWAYEWFREPGRPAGRCGDVFASVR